MIDGSIGWSMRPYTSLRVPRGQGVHTESFQAALRRRRGICSSIPTSLWLSNLHYRSENKTCGRSDHLRSFGKFLQTISASMRRKKNILLQIKQSDIGAPGLGGGCTAVVVSDFNTTEPIVDMIEEQFFLKETIANSTYVSAYS